MYLAALSVRRERGLGSGSLAWWPEHDDEGLVAFVNGNVLVAMNMGDAPVQLPELPVLAVSAPSALEGTRLRPNRTVWLQLD
jgi:alpha-glucosidase